MQTHEIRRRFLEFFAAREHMVQPSASLISADPTVLFTIAGMAPMKPYFLGEQTPPAPRVTSVQKCVRTNDIDNVGLTTRHNTFFQMAGNFSFGDYFKDQAITFAWDLITTSQTDGGYGFDPDRIWVTVYEHDDEAAELWRTIAGLPAERIQKRGMADNFWSMGVPGPCGPCSEIYFDRGPEFGAEGGPVVDEDRYLEIWNLVFMQHIRGEGTGKGDFEILGNLPTPNIDTGLGVERVAFLLQGVDNVYETDLLRPLISTAEQFSGRRYGAEAGDDIRFRVIADHLRSSVMLVADGVVPGNEGRGYVLRRLMRRAIRAARLLGVTEPIMGHLVGQVCELMGDSYPELGTETARILAVAQAEEQSFLRTLTAGSKLFSNTAAAVKDAGGQAVTGTDAFTLHDTYGFPIDLTLEMAAEAGLTVDTAGFADLMEQQKARARADAKARKGGFADLSAFTQLLDTAGPTAFTGYTELQSEATVLALLRDGQRVGSAADGDIVDLVLDRTPLYAESGGQESDAGLILAGSARAEVLDVQKVNRKLWVHQIRITDGALREGEQVVAQVDPEWRTGARQAHSGTHLVHAALRQVLGPQALQSGSYNKPGYLRLDFSWTGPLSPAARHEIEDVSNLAVRKDLPVAIKYASLPEAKAMGAIALFGETYDQTVRIIEIGGPWSIELCGGTHVEHSSQVGPISLIGESSVGSGLRRLEAYVGIEAFRQLATERALLAGLAGMLKVPADQVPGRVEQLITRLKDAEKELAGLRSAALASSAATLAAGAADVSGVALVAATLPGEVSAGDLRSLVSDIRAKLADRPGVVVLFSVAGDGLAFAVASTAAAAAAGHRAGTLVKAMVEHIGGRGGGRDDLAQGGGTNPGGIEAAVGAIRTALGAAS